MWLPVQALVHGRSPVELNLESWVSWTIDGANLLLPSAPNDESRLQTPNGTLSFVVDDSKDVGPSDIEAALLKDCACIVEDRTPVWISGQIGVRYRLAYPHPKSPRTSEVWAIPMGKSKMLYIAAIVEEVTSGPGALSTGRTVLSLLGLEPPP